jgi:SAM-dependent methyltransferase
MWYFATTIFVSAFLLFQVQPLIGKYILPWFGGTNSVWTACMMFFQIVLLLGYIYSHLLIRFLRPSRQCAVHVSLIIIALFFLPVAPSASWKPLGTEDPLIRILLMLFASVGFPYFIVSTTGPLLQAWFSRKFQGESPYPLYALSNIGSLLALVTYPFFIEHLLTRYQQAVVWSAGFCLFAALCVFSAWKYGLLRKDVTGKESSPASLKPEENIPAERIALWFVLPMMSCILLLAVTSQLCIDVASVPFLWIVPLTIYLLSFIVCFSNLKVYSRWIYLIVFNILVGLLLYVMRANISLIEQILIYSGLLFVSCMILHGELYRIKPLPGSLTLYYLMISAGGAAGGIFAGIIAVRIYPVYLELFTGIVGCYIFLFISLYMDKSDWIHRAPYRPVWIVLLMGFCFTLYNIQGRITDNLSGYLLIKRNFYGVMRVWDNKAGNPKERRLFMYHGAIVHGFQYTDESRRREPASYFTKTSGAGLTELHYPKQRNRRVGVIGLGTGTLAAYGQEGDYYKFYEINPDVIKAATSVFTYVADSPARCDIAPGDARLVLEREKGQNFDMLFMDAFSSDSIPVHLLTREAFAVYLKHLAPEGVIVVNASNRYVNIVPVVSGLADFYKLKLLEVNSREDEKTGALSATYLLATRNEDFINKIKSVAAEFPEDKKAKKRMVEISEVFKKPGYPFWTDDFSNLFQILK